MSSNSVAVQLGLASGEIVQEFGYDDDVDRAFRAAIEEITGAALEDEDYRGVADCVIAWWRSDDGDVDDLADYLVDCAASLDEGIGAIWLLVPSVSSSYHVSAADVSEAAETAGQSATTTLVVSHEWTAVKLTTRNH